MTTQRALLWVTVAVALCAVALADIAPVAVGVCPAGYVALPLEDEDVVGVADTISVDRCVKEVAVGGSMDFAAAEAACTADLATATVFSLDTLSDDFLMATNLDWVKVTTVCSSDCWVGLTLNGLSAADVENWLQPDPQWTDGTDFTHPCILGSGGTDLDCTGWPLFTGFDDGDGCTILSGTQLEGVDCAASYSTVLCEATSSLDADNDGVFDEDDFCLESPTASVDTFGCTAEQVDSDLDGVCDSVTPMDGMSYIATPHCAFPSGADFDLCPTTPSMSTVDDNGCTIDAFDADRDGICDIGSPRLDSGEFATTTFCKFPDTEVKYDMCPDTRRRERVDGNGCASRQLDPDRDGICNAPLMRPVPGSGKYFGTKWCNIPGIAPAGTTKFQPLLDNCPEDFNPVRSDWAIGATGAAKDLEINLNAIVDGAAASVYGPLQDDVCESGSPVQTHTSGAASTSEASEEEPDMASSSPADSTSSPVTDTADSSSSQSSTDSSSSDSSAAEASSPSSSISDTTTPVVNTESSDSSDSSSSMAATVDETSTPEEADASKPASSSSSKLSNTTTVILISEAVATLGIAASAATGAVLHVRRSRSPPSQKVKIVSKSHSASLSDDSGAKKPKRKANKVRRHSSSRGSRRSRRHRSSDSMKV